MAEIKPLRALHQPRPPPRACATVRVAAPEAAGRHAPVAARTPPPAASAAARPAPSAGSGPQDQYPGIPLLQPPEIPLALSGERISSQGRGPIRAIAAWRSPPSWRTMSRVCCPCTWVTSALSCTASGNNGPPARPERRSRPAGSGSAAGPAPLSAPPRHQPRTDLSPSAPGPPGLPSARRSPPAAHPELSPGRHVFPDRRCEHFADDHRQALGSILVGRAQLTGSGMNGGSGGVSQCPLELIAED